MNVVCSLHLTILQQLVTCEVYMLPPRDDHWETHAYVGCREVRRRACISKKSTMLRNRNSKTAKHHVLIHLSRVLSHHRKQYLGRQTRERVLAANKSFFRLKKLGNSRNIYSLILQSAEIQ